MYLCSFFFFFSAIVVGPCFKGDNMDISSIPPGFESLVPFPLRKMEHDQVSNYSSAGKPFRAENIQLESRCNDAKTGSSHGYRSFITQNQLDSSSIEQIEQV